MIFYPFRQGYFYLVSSQFREYVPTALPLQGGGERVVFPIIEVSVEGLCRLTRREKKAIQKCKGVI
jgi:hypothetical protein